MQHYQPHSKSCVFQAGTIFSHTVQSGLQQCRVDLARLVKQMWPGKMTVFPVQLCLLLLLS